MADSIESGEIPPRAQMAKEYFEADHNLRNQQRWYSNKAGSHKSWHHWLGLVVLTAGAGTSVIQLWAPAPPNMPVHWVTIATAMLGAIVVLARGIERIWDFDGTWAAYRKASELMKRERRLFVNGAGPYVETPGDEEAYILFVNRIEEIIAAEQETFWSAREAGDGKSSSGEASTG